MSGVDVLAPVGVWILIGGVLQLGVFLTHIATQRYTPDLVYEDGGFLRLGRGPEWLRYVWSTPFIFLIVVPCCVLFVTIVMGAFLAIVLQWDINDAYNYHVGVLGLTSHSDGHGELPQSTVEAVLAVLTTLTSLMCLYAIAGLAGMGTMNRFVAMWMPSGLRGLALSIFAYFPSQLLFFSIPAAGLLAWIEDWHYGDSLILAGGWLSGVDIEIRGCTIETSAGMFVVMICRIVAVAIKLSICNIMFGNSFPRWFIRQLDGPSLSELEEDMWGEKPPAMVPEISIDFMDAPTLKSEVIRLRTAATDLYEENQELRESAEEALMCLQDVMDSAIIMDCDRPAATQQNWRRALEAINEENFAAAHPPARSRFRTSSGGVTQMLSRMSHTGSISNMFSTSSVPASAGAGAGAAGAAGAGGAGTVAGAGGGGGGGGGGHSGARRHSKTSNFSNGSGGNAMGRSCSNKSVLSSAAALGAANIALRAAAGPGMPFQQFPVPQEGDDADSVGKSSGASGHGAHVIGRQQQHGEGEGSSERDGFMPTAPGGARFLAGGGGQGGAGAGGGPGLGVGASFKGGGGPGGELGSGGGLSRGVSSWLASLTSCWSQSAMFGVTPPIPK